MSLLFSPTRLGDIAVDNRIVMAPMTRGRAGYARIANELMAEYYAQRATAGLIITEATPVSPQGYGWDGAPAIYNDAQEAAWTDVTRAVHSAGGKIILQLWHTGRVSHPHFLGGDLPVGPSPIKAAGESHTPWGKKPYVVPRELAVEELEGIANDFAEAARRAVRAGFDGVEVHSANGYLLDQFLRDGSNQRLDDFGGSIENRVRFPLMVIRAVIEAVGSGRTGVRVSPTNPFNDMHDSDSLSLFTHYAERLTDLDLAYLHVMEPFSKEHPFFHPGEHHTPHLRKAYTGHMMINGGYLKDTAQAALDAGAGDTVAFGVPYIANPDLVARFRDDKELALPDPATFYTLGPEGYTDYPPAD